MYAPKALPSAAPIAIRLIGVLDARLVDAFAATERALPASAATRIVEVGDVQLLGAAEVDRLLRVVARARSEGRDVRIDARTLPWRHAVRRTVPGQHAAVDQALRTSAARTVIIAHSGKRRR